MHTLEVRAALVILFIALIGGGNTARAKIVVMEPTVVYQCRTLPDWNGVVACMGKLGHIAGTRAATGGKLVTITGDNAGIYLFVQKVPSGPWTIAGIYQNGNAVILDFTPVTLNKHAGYRIDLGADLEVGIQVDPMNAISGRARQTIALFCGGDNYYCEQAMIACDARAHGRSYNVFRGTLRIDGNEVHVDGDRTRAGTACQGTDHFFLGWSPTPAK